MILVDSNIWIDLIQKDVKWLDWSLEQVQRARSTGAVVVNPVIYAELSAAYDTEEEVNYFFRMAKATVKPITRPAAFAAGRAFLRYRQQRGTKTGVLPDFFIGAQAQTEGWTILTRDKSRYQTYFPSVKLICP